MLYERLRAMKGDMTAQQIADKSGVPVATVNRVLQGLTENPGFDTVYKLVKAMGGSLNDLDVAARARWQTARVPCQI